MQRMQRTEQIPSRKTIKYTLTSPTMASSIGDAAEAVPSRGVCNARNFSLVFMLSMARKTTK